MTYYTITKNGKDTGMRYASATEAEIAIIEAQLWRLDQGAVYEVITVEN